MNNSPESMGIPQGFGLSTAERFPIPEREAISEAQRAAADAIVNSPAQGDLRPLAAGAPAHGASGEDR